MSTNCTSCFASALKIRFGSSGATFALISDTAGVMQELAQVLDFLEPLLRRHPQDAGHIVEHVRSHNDAWFELRVELEIHGGQQPVERLPGRTRLPLFDASDDRLRGAGP